MSIGRSKAIVLKNSWREWLHAMECTISDAGSKNRRQHRQYFATERKLSENYKLFKQQS
jgi:hypothetical protein